MYAKEVSVSFQDRNRPLVKGVEEKTQRNNEEGSEESLAEEEVCEICDGTGEVNVPEPVYPGEPHMAMIGTRPCICQQ